MAGLAGSGPGTIFERAAEKLLQEHRSKLPFSPLVIDGFTTTEASGYRVQREFIRLKMRVAGASCAGYKVGLTSSAMQSMCGIDNPVAGVVLSNEIHTSPAQISRSEFVRLGLEFEIAIRIGRDVEPTNEKISTVGIAAHVAGVGAAIELIDDRACDYASLDAFSLIADNAWNEGIILGAFSLPIQGLAELRGVVRVDGTEIARGRGSDILGHPYASLAWLANQLIERGEYLREGDIVMTGSLVKTQFPFKASQYDFELGDLGNVHCRVEP